MFLLRIRITMESGNMEFLALSTQSLTSLGSLKSLFLLPGICLMSLLQESTCFCQFLIKKTQFITGENSKYSTIQGFTKDKYIEEQRMTVYLVTK